MEPAENLRSAAEISLEMRDLRRAQENTHKRKRPCKHLPNPENWSHGPFKGEEKQSVPQNSSKWLREKQKSWFLICKYVLFPFKNTQISLCVGRILLSGDNSFFIMKRESMEAIYPHAMSYVSRTCTQTPIT